MTTATPLSREIRGSKTRPMWLSKMFGVLGIRKRLRNQVHRKLREIVAVTPYIGGGDGTAGFNAADRVHIAPNTSVNNAIFNVNGGSITVEEFAFCGSGVSLLTGSHNPSLIGLDRMVNVDREGHDIIVETGAWLASNVSVVGPCRIGANAVVAAGAVVISDVAPGEIVGGVPAVHIGWIEGADPTTPMFQAGGS